MNNTTAAMTMDQQPTGAARIGMEMRLVRERLGWRLPDVAAELRIRLPYLEAIERGELSALPGAAYQTGFVRTYSQALGLDGDEILRRFRAEGTGFVQKAELSFLAPVPDRAVPTGAIVLLGVVLVLVGYGLWYRHTAAVAQLAAQIPAIPTELAPLAVPPKPPAPVAVATAKPAPAASQAAPPAPFGAGTAASSPAAAPGAGAQAQPAQPQSVQPQLAAPAGPGAAQSVAAATPPSPAAASPAAPSPAPQKTIVATGDSWVEVQDAKGGILFSKTLHAGDSWPVPDLPGLVMTAGNAGATIIAENGATGAPLGAAGTVIRRYALTAPAPGAAATPGAAAPATSPHAEATPHPATAAPASLPAVYTPSTTPAPQAPITAGAVEGPSPSAPVRTN
jgi:cytoskeleton protein RodZ